MQCNKDFHMFTMGKGRCADGNRSQSASRETGTVFTTVLTSDVLIQILAQTQERLSLTTLAGVGLVILYPVALYTFLKNAYHYLKVSVKLFFFNYLSE